MVDPNSNPNPSDPDPSSFEPMQRGPGVTPVAAEPNEVLLRSRDVQALSRTFRRLAEIQDGLADQLRNFEEERRNKWILPAIAIGSMALGVGLAIIGMVWAQKQTPAQPLEVKFDNLPAQQSQVQNSEGGLDAELMQAMVQRLEKMDQAQSQDRRMISELGTKLVENEMSALSLLKELSELEASQPMEAVAAVAPQGNASPNAVVPNESGNAVEPERLGYPPNPWLGALNGLIAVDGYPHFRFQKATRVDGIPRLSDVVFFIWNEEGLLQSIVRVESVDFILFESTFSVQLHFQSGTRTRQGVKSVFPEGGLNVFLPDINVPAWLAHFPELSPMSMALQEMAESMPASPAEVGQVASDSSAASAVPVKPISATETLRLAVDELLAQKHTFGHYRLERMERVEGDALKMVRLAWYNGQGELFKYMEADTLRIRPRGEGWVELNLENGCFIRLNKKSPFRDSVHRIQLPDQDLAAWKATGVPLIE